MWIAAGSLTALLLCAMPAAGQKFYTYVGRIGEYSALVAWGRTEGGGNTIGRDSRSYGNAELHINGRAWKTSRNWVEVSDLQPDTVYPYQVFLEGKPIGGGRLRTHPVRANRMAFFVIGDYGDGSPGQHGIAAAMLRELQRLEAAGNPPRFVLTTGDNIYARWLLFLPTQTGDRDQHWERRFFQPYEKLLERIPFYATLGNHDCNQSESRGDLSVYLDNFFFPGGAAARYYTFSYAGLADFFALDSSSCTESGPGRHALLEGGQQHRWLEQALNASRAPWKIAYFHHPPFSAGPHHKPSLGALRHVVDLLGARGVQVAFNGHEHNLQFSTRDEATRGVLYVVSGAGGRLRDGDVRGRMRDAHISGWAPQREFLSVEIEGAGMKITPLGEEPLRVVDPDNQPLELPVRLSIRH